MGLPFIRLLTPIIGIRPAGLATPGRVFDWLIDGGPGGRAARPDRTADAGARAPRIGATASGRPA
jgi:hypothetical protein